MNLDTLKVKLQVNIPILLVLITLASCKDNYQEDLLIALDKNIELQTLISKAEDDAKKYKKLFIECQSLQTEKIEVPIVKEIKPSVEKGTSNNPEIGKWKTPAIYGGGSVRLFKKGEEYFKTESFPDGTSFTHKMSMTKQGENRVFKSLEKVSSDTWVVNQSGKLSIVDKVGLVYSVD